LTAESPKEAPLEETGPSLDTTAQDKAARKAAKKAAAAERAAAKAKAAQEKAEAKAAEKAKLAAEKAAEKEKATMLKLEKEKERLEQDKARLEKEKAEKELVTQIKAEKEKQEKAKVEQERLAKEKAVLAAKEAKKAAKAIKQVVPQEVAKAATDGTASPPTPDTPVQGPLLSRMPKKNKPTTKPIRIPKEGDIIHDTTSAVPSATAETPPVPPVRASAFIETQAHSQSTDFSLPTGPLSVAALLEQIDKQQPWMNIPKHPFFDLSKVNPAARMPLEYGPLVHALSALSVGGGSFANNMPSGSIDNAVSSFQQLLETLTQTISDLLRLLPRTTWDDSSSFDGVLRDMLKGDDFLDDNGEDGSAREDEVAALTLALERRARWMEVQLSKLEELHRDINNAAVRAVLSFNDKGWDKHGFLPRVGNTLRRFDNLGYVSEGEGSEIRPMTIQELEEKLLVAKEAAVFAETEVREAMQKVEQFKPSDYEDC
jgi:CCR4-NOT transcription complex subunit 4